MSSPIDILLADVPDPAKRETLARAFHALAEGDGQSVPAQFALVAVSSAGAAVSAAKEIAATREALRADLAELVSSLRAETAGLATALAEGNANREKLLGAATASREAAQIATRALDAMSGFESAAFDVVTQHAKAMEAFNSGILDRQTIAANACAERITGPIQDLYRTTRGRWRKEFADALGAATLRLFLLLLPLSTLLAWLLIRFFSN